MCSADTSGDEDLNGFSGTWQFLSSQVHKKLGQPMLSAWNSTLQLPKLKMQTNRELYSLQCLCMVQQLIGLFAACMVSPKKPAELKFKDIAEIVQKHYDPSPLALCNIVVSVLVIVVLEIEISLNICCRASPTFKSL